MAVSGRGNLDISLDDCVLYRDPLDSVEQFSRFGFRD